jgi:ribonucleoside-triphosphate reductase (formate)
VFEQIKKRDGRIVEFESSKITTAILKAGQATNEFGEREARKLTLRVLTLAHEMRLGSLPEVEEVQDIVEHVLLASPYHITAKAYILYREQHAQIRSIATKANVDLVDHYIQRLDWKIKENSNMCYSLQGLNNYISSDVTSEYWLNKIYPPQVRQAHKQGDLHIHDLSLLSVYCVGWDLKDLLKNGFKGVEGKVESAPPKHLRSALGQIVNFFYTLQGEAAGAQALSNFDTLLAPFVREDGLTTKRSSRPAGICLQHQHPHPGGVPDAVYQYHHGPVCAIDSQGPAGDRGRRANWMRPTADFQPEMDLINRAFADVMMAGDAKGRVFTFPIPTYNITPDFDWDNPNLDMVWQMTAKYGIPYFSNFVNSDMKPEDARSMCCRLRLDNRELLKRGGGLFGANPLTGSIGVVTINLPRIGYQADGEKDFFRILEERVRLAVESLSIKRKVLEKFTERNLYPYSRFYLREIKQGSDLYWKNHFSTIGIIGMNEACLNFMGKDIGTMEGQAFALKVMDALRALLSQFQDDSGDFFNLEATPAEGTSFRLAMLDKRKFPDIICSNDAEFKKGASPYYTNSTQLPVNYTDDLHETLQLQDQLQTKYTGGTVLHVFLGEQLGDIEAVKSLVRKISANYRLPYFTLTPTFSICPSHGYLRGEQVRCAHCNQETEIYSRVVGTCVPSSSGTTASRPNMPCARHFGSPPWMRKRAFP